MKQTLAFDPAAEGRPVALDSNGDYLAVATSLGMVRVYRMTGREARPHAGPGGCNMVVAVEGLAKEVHPSMSAYITFCHGGSAQRDESCHGSLP